MEQALYFWTPSIAPSGMIFLRSDRYGKAWQGSLFPGALKSTYLGRPQAENGKVAREEELLQEFDQRIRDVRAGPDGLLYFLADQPTVYGSACNSCVETQPDRHSGLLAQP